MRDFDDATHASTLPITVPATPCAPSPADSAPAKPKISVDPVRPALPSATTAGKVTPPAIKSNIAPATTSIAAAQPPAPPAEPELPANKEVVQGNLYTNFSHG